MRTPAAHLTCACCRCLATLFCAVPHFHCVTQLHPLLYPSAGSTANTIKSSNYGSWGHSYRFKPVANLTCASTNAQNLLVNATVTKSFAVCPMNCFSAGGNIYGSSAAYRSNSRICLAAVS